MRRRKFVITMRKTDRAIGGVREGRKGTRYRGRTGSAGEGISQEADDEAADYAHYGGEGDCSGRLTERDAADEDDGFKS